MTIDPTGWKRAFAGPDYVMMKMEPTSGSYKPPSPTDLIPIDTGTGPLTHDYTPIFAAVDVASGRDRTAVVIMTSPSAAYWIAEVIEREDERIRATMRAEGQRLYEDEVYEALAAAGIRVEETGRSVTLHLPSGGGAVDGRVLANAMSMPVSADDLFFPRDVLPPPRRGNQPDYLRHDPTKRHRRVRRKR
jgi:hypothetical protein